MTTHSANSERVARLFPHLDLSQHDAVKAPCYARVEKNGFCLGNGLVELSVQRSPEGLDFAYVRNKIAGAQIPVYFSPVEAVLDFGAIASSQARTAGIRAFGSDYNMRLVHHLSFDAFEVEVSYVVNRGDHFTRKSLIIHSVKKPARLNQVTLFHHKFGNGIKVIRHDAGMFFPVVFARGAHMSIFCCCEIPGYFANVNEQEVQFTYYPGEILEPGRSFQTTTAKIGVAALEGRYHKNPYHETGAELDAGEEQWFRAHLLRGMTSTRDLPYVEVRGAVGAPLEPSDFEALTQCELLGAQHVMLPRMVADPDAYPYTASLRERMAKQGVSPGFRWSRDKETQLRIVPVGAQNENGQGVESSYFAFDEFRESMVDHYLDLMERHGFSDIEISGSPILPYRSVMDEAGPEADSRELLHKAFAGLVDVVVTLKESFGHVHCSGHYTCYGAGTASLFDATAPLAESHPLALPDIHPGRLFADMGRLYFRRSHAFLLPSRRLTNTIGFPPEASPEAPYPGAEQYPWSAYHDSESWRYALLSAIATGLRHRFFPLPSGCPKDDLAFAKEWLIWERKNLHDLLEPEPIFDGPGLDKLDGYSYTKPDRAIVFLFNPTYDPQPVRLELRLTASHDYMVRERYPRDYYYRGPNRGLFAKNSILDLSLNPKEARVITVEKRPPEAEKRKKPEVFGAPFKSDGRRVTVRGEAGHSAEIGVRFAGEYHKRVIRFPGRRLETQLTEWRATSQDLESGLTAGLHEGAFKGRPLLPRGATRTNLWLITSYKPPLDLAAHINTSPFHLRRPCWTYPDRLFFVIRYEPPPHFDPIRTSCDATGIPESYLAQQPIKCGIDLAPLNLGFRAWVNGHAQDVYPALAAWRRYWPNPNPVVAYFFEAGSLLKFGAENRIVLFANRLTPADFRGIHIEHLPPLSGEKVIEL